MRLLDDLTSPPKERYAIPSDNITTLVQPGAFDDRKQRTETRRDTRAGAYERRLGTKAGEVTLKVPKLRKQTFETERPHLGYRNQGNPPHF